MNCTVAHLINYTFATARVEFGFLCLSVYLVLNPEDRTVYEIEPMTGTVKTVYTYRAFASRAEAFSAISENTRFKDVRKITAHELGLHGAQLKSNILNELVFDGKAEFFENLENNASRQEILESAKIIRNRDLEYLANNQHVALDILRRVALEMVKAKGLVK